MTHKEFKPFDRVLVKVGSGKWEIDLYSHWDKESENHITLAYGEGLSVSDKDILPYEGNEKLVGKTDEPDEEVKLEEGEWLMVTNADFNKANGYELRQYYKIDDSSDKICTELITLIAKWNFAVRFSDFNPNDMEETSRHILCVKNGKIVRYKSE